MPLSKYSLLNPNNKRSGRECEGLFDTVAGTVVSMGGTDTFGALNKIGDIILSSQLTIAKIRTDNKTNVKISFIFYMF